MRTHPPAGRLAAGVDDLWPEPFGKPRSRDLTVMGSKAEPATALKSAAERRSSPAQTRRQFDHVTSFLKGRGWVRCAELAAICLGGCRARTRRPHDDSGNWLFAAHESPRLFGAAEGQSGQCEDRRAHQSLFLRRGAPG